MTMSLSRGLSKASVQLKRFGQVQEQDNWQGRKAQYNMFETFNVNLSNMVVPETVEDLQAEIKPDLPWAEDHFQERISGIPMNPAPSYQWWPYYKNDEKWRVDGKFSHTYPERFWTPKLDGIRYQYGNLQDVIDLLKREPHTRQAFLPMWFPEDTGAVHGERVPCTIGYQFYIRNKRLYMYYPMRSCDFRRHLKNDIYMASRMMQHVSQELGIRPATLTMNIWNLHIFEGEEVFL